MEVWQWLIAWWTWAQARLAQLLGRFMPARTDGPPTRDDVLHELRLVEVGTPRVSVEDIAAAGSAAAASAAVRARAVRASSTDAGGKRAVRQLREFLVANPALLARPGPATGESYDILVEAFVFAEAAVTEGQPCPWSRARRPQDPSAARGAGAARGLLDRLGWSRGTTWTRSRAMGKAWSVRDDTAVSHTEPIFAWELVDGLRLRPPKSPWEMAGAAMSVIGVLHAKRVSGVKRLRVGEVARVAEDAVSVTTTVKVKARATASKKRGGGKGKPFVLRHWLVRDHLLPWLEWHGRRRSPDSALLFPAITARRSPAATALGFATNGMWVEPMRQWSARQVAAWLQLFIPNIGTRGFHGWRAGNNRELRRRREVHDVTRRALHERSLRTIIGSEAHYDEAFAEDYAEATEVLGRMRIERDPRSGLLTVTATSDSAGEHQDWVGVARPLALAVADDGGSDTDGSESTSDGGSDGDSSDAGNVVGDAGRESRSYRCGRCGDAVTERDYGFMCDIPGCAWGTCTACHPGGSRAKLLCPDHC